MPGLQPLGQTEVMEDIHAIYSQRARHHPLVQAVLSAAPRHQTNPPH